MKMKKLVSAIAALAMSVSAFTAFAAEGDVTTNASANFDDATYGGAVVGQQWTPNSSFSDAGWLLVGNTSSIKWEIADEQLAGSTDVVTVKFKVAYGRLSKKDFYYTISDSNGTAIVDWKFRAYDGTLTTNVLGNGNDLPATSEFYYANNTPLTDRAADLTFTIDFANRTVTQSTLNLYNNVTTTHTNPLPASVADVKTLMIGSNYNNADRRCAVDDVSITTTEGAEAEIVDYTVNYALADGTEVKTVSGQISDGAPVQAEDCFEVDGTRYYITAAEVPTMTVTAGATNVLDVEVRVADTYAGNVVASTGDAISTYSVVEGDSFTYSNSMYLTDADNKVTAKADNNSFTTTITPTAGGDITIPYTAYEGTAYFVEQEDITQSAANQQLASANYSGGVAFRGDNYGVEAFTVAEAGTYKITVAGSCRNTNNNSVFSVYKNVAFTTSTETAEDGSETTVYTEVPENLLFNGDFKGTSQNTVQSQGTISTTEDVTLAAGDVIILAGDNGQSWIDYILVEKTGDVEVDEPVLTTDPPMVEVEDFGEYTEYLGNPAKAYTGTFTVDPTKHYPVSSLTWYVGEASTDTNFETIISSGTVVTGLVVVAPDLSTIPEPWAWCNLYYGE